MKFVNIKSNFFPTKLIIKKKKGLDLDWVVENEAAGNQITRG